MKSTLVRKGRSLKRLRLKGFSNNPPKEENAGFQPAYAANLERVELKKCSPNIDVQHPSGLFFYDSYSPHFMRGYSSSTHIVGSQTRCITTALSIEKALSLKHIGFFGLQDVPFDVVNIEPESVA